MSLGFSGLKKRFHSHSKMPRNSYWLGDGLQYYIIGNRIYVTKILNGGIFALDDRISDGSRLDVIRNMADTYRNMILL